MEKEKKSFIRELVETIVVVAFLVIVIRGFVGEPRWIPSASMRATLLEGDRVFIEKITTKHNFREIKRGDILVFYPPFTKLRPGLWAKFTRFVGLFDKNEAYIKRVVATEGEKFKIGSDAKTGRSVVYINGKQLKEDYLYDNATRECVEDMTCEGTVPKGMLLMLGDNRANSQDGRYWGFLPKDRVIGRAVFMFWPLNRLRIFTTPEY
ncbi:MAG: signal peptidase I [bacterium]|nr:signal peptidase I [bacterium]